MYLIISDQIVIILYIEFILLALVYYCKRKKCIPLLIYYSNDDVVDVLTIRENRNFHLRFL